MTERPILFTAEMVRAILDGRKTQTRRVIKYVATYETFDSCKDGVATIKAHIYGDHYAFNLYTCPYGKPGDTLWVRETWLEDRLPRMPKNERGALHYKANGYTYQEIVDSWSGHWRRSIFMPRWASRIDLEITNVRVERLQEISEEDARAEGLIRDGGMWRGAKNLHVTAGYAFASIWDSINAKRGYPWESNPWVWIIEFRRAK